MAYFEVVVNKESKLSKFFRTFEKAEYLITALTVLENHSKRVHIRNGKILIGQVLSHTIEDLISSRNSYPSIKVFLYKNSYRITKAFKYTLDPFKKYQKTINGQNRLAPDNIDYAWSRWQEFISS